MRNLPTRPFREAGVLDPANAEWPSVSLRRFASEALFPRDWFGILVLLAAFLRIALWFANIRQAMPHAGMDVWAIFRFNGGDAQYFDIVQSLAQGNLGETAVLEEQGFGFRSFPFYPLFIPSALFRALGPGGFFIGDFISIWIYVACGTFMMRCLGLVLGVARGVTLMTLATHWWAVSEAICGKATLNFWCERLPRPAWTFPPFLLSIALIAVLVNSPAHRRKPALWVALGICSSLLVQGDLHTGITVGLFIGAMVAWFIMKPDAPRSSIARNVFAMAGAGLVALAPFLAARLLEHPDAPARLGKIPVDRLHPFVDFQILPYTLAAILVTGGAAAGYRWLMLPNPSPASAAISRVTLLFPASLIIAYFALPISTILLGQGAQLFHFRDSIRYLVSFYLAFLAGLLAQVIGVRWQAGPNPPRTPRQMGILASGTKFAVLLIAIAAIVATFGMGKVPDDIRPNTDPREVPQGRRQGYVELTQAVKPLRAAGCDVIATFDPQVYAWWVDMLGGHSYMPEIFTTTLPDCVIERRLAQTCKLLGMSEDQFEAYLRTFDAQYDFIGECKYNATRAYAIAPLTDYEPEEQAKIRQLPRTQSYNYTVPISERRRLRALFRNTDASDSGLARLDFFVLHARDCDNGLKPPSERFQQVFSNAFYQVWTRKNISLPK